MLAELLEKQQTEQAAREAAEARCREVEAAAEEASSTVAQRGLWDLFTLLFRRFVLWLSCFFSLQARVDKGLTPPPTLSAPVYTIETHKESPNAPHVPETRQLIRPSAEARKQSHNRVRD